MSSSEPYLAVIIPCYNAEAWIDRAVASVLSQSYPRISLIVVDDGSSDGSVAKLQALGNRITLEVGPNHGACHARNRGLQIAREQGASHVLFLDADDYLTGEMLAGAAQAASATGADMVLSNLHLEHTGGRIVERFVYSGRIDPAIFFEGWMEGRNFIPSSVLWRIDFVDRVGGWDESLRRSQDTDISLRAMFLEPLIIKNDRGAAIYSQVNPSSVSRVNSRSATESRIRVYTGLIDRAKGTRFQAFEILMLHKLYAVTRIAFQTGHPDLGRQGLAVMKRHAFHRNPGSRAHRIISGLIGLEAKVRLWGN